MATGFGSSCLFRGRMEEREAGGLSSSFLGASQAVSHRALGMKLAWKRDEARSSAGLGWTKKQGGGEGNKNITARACNTVRRA